MQENSETAFRKSLRRYQAREPASCFIKLPDAAEATAQPLRVIKPSSRRETTRRAGSPSPDVLYLPGDEDSSAASSDQRSAGENEDRGARGIESVERGASDGPQPFEPGYPRPGNQNLLRGSGIKERPFRPPERRASSRPPERGAGIRGASKERSKESTASAPGRISAVPVKPLKLYKCQHFVSELERRLGSPVAHSGAGPPAARKKAQSDALAACNDFEKYLVKHKPKKIPKSDDTERWREIGERCEILLSKYGRDHGLERWALEERCVSLCVELRHLCEAVDERVLWAGAPSGWSGGVASSKESVGGRGGPMGGSMGSVGAGAVGLGSGAAGGGGSYRVSDSLMFEIRAKAKERKIKRQEQERREIFPPGGGLPQGEDGVVHRDYLRARTGQPGGEFGSSRPLSPVSFPATSPKAKGKPRIVRKYNSTNPWNPLPSSGNGVVDEDGALPSSTVPDPEIHVSAVVEHVPEIYLEGETAEVVSEQLPQPVAEGDVLPPEEVDEHVSRGPAGAAVQSADWSAEVEAGPAEVVDSTGRDGPPAEPPPEEIHSVVAPPVASPVVVVPTPSPGPSERPANRRADEALRLAAVIAERGGPPLTEVDPAPPTSQRTSRQQQQEARNTTVGYDDDINDFRVTEEPGGGQQEDINAFRVLQAAASAEAEGTTTTTRAVGRTDDDSGGADDGGSESQI